MSDVGSEQPAVRIEPGRAGALAWLVVFGLLTCAATSVWMVIVELDRARYAGRVGRSTVIPSYARTTSLDHHVAIARSTSFAVLLLTAIVFITWHYRMLRRLELSRGELLRHSTGWVIWGWFVPLFNLVRPKQMINDAWRATATTTTPRPRVAVRVHLWWAFWVLSLVLSAVGANSPRGTPENLSEADRVSAAADTFTVLAALLAVAVVVGLSRRESLVPQPLPLLARPGMMLFNPPPGWPTPQGGWSPPPGWQPDPSWPPAPEGWAFWVPRHERGPAEWSND
jgi:hypothetical protein